MVSWIFGFLPTLFALGILIAGIIILTVKKLWWAFIKLRSFIPFSLFLLFLLITLLELVDQRIGYAVASGIVSIALLVVQGVGIYTLAR